MSGVIVGYFAGSLFSYLFWHKNDFALGQLVASGTIMVITWIVGAASGN